MQAKKTHEQQLRILQNRDDVPKPGEIDVAANSDAPEHAPRHPEARQSEMPVSRGGMNQESRHNKHNHPEAGPHRG